jgi:superfamily II DNA or RNA helicase
MFKNWRQTIAGGRGRGRGRGSKKVVNETSMEMNLTIEYKKIVCDNSYIGGKGYTIPKSVLYKEDLAFLMKDLFLTPQTNGPSYGEDTNAFPVYRENDKKIYIPRFYGVERYGLPSKNEFNTNIYPSINIPFEKPLRDYQDTIIDTYMNHIQKEGEGGIVQVPCGRGKCLGKNTQILMYNGTIKLVQDICVGDILMGDNSTPRNVITLARGKEMMYRIITSKNGKGYIVNESHILSLKHKDNRILDISVIDYLNNIHPSLKQNLYGYRVAIDFTESGIEVDPYLLGYWLGLTSSRMSTKYLDLNPSLKIFCQKYNLIIDTTNSFGRRSICVNKYIPHCYKCNSRTIRLNLLKGIINSSNSSTSDLFYKISHHKKVFIYEIMYLCRSLGISIVKQYFEKSEKSKTTITESIRKIVSNIFVNTYDIDYKQYNKNYTIVLNKSLVDKVKNYNQCSSEKYTFNIQKLDIDYYYGFEIDGNHRFVLGDFTVTHNTVMALKIMSLMAKKTLIVVHKEFLLNQWIERINEFIPNAKVGRIQGPIFESEGKDIVIGMIQTLYDREFHQGAFDDFGFTVVDETHRIGSAQFSKTLIRLQSPYYLGITATLERKDGLTRGIHMFMGKLIYSETDRNTDTVNVRGIIYIAPPSETEFNNVETDFRGNTMCSTMISKLCAFAPRTHFILRVLADLIKENPEAQILVLGHNRCILVELFDEIEDTKFATSGFYIGGMKESKLKESTEKQIILATFSMAAEGFDCKTLSILVMITPKVDIIQSVGRILREKHENTIIVDIIDSHNIFQNQWNKRRLYYKKCNYSIKTISNTEYSGMDLKNDKKWKTVFEPKTRPEIKDDEDEESENIFNNPNKISSCIFEPIIG